MSNKRKLPMINGNDEKEKEGQIIQHGNRRLPIKTPRGKKSTPNEKEKCCSNCNSMFPMNSYSKSQWSKSDHIIRCKKCVLTGPPLPKRRCSSCKVVRTKVRFTSQSWMEPDASKICCKECVKTDTKKDDKKSDDEAKMVKKEKTIVKKVKIEKKEDIDALLREMAQMPPPDVPTTFQLDWKLNPITVSDEKIVAKQAVLEGCFGLISEEEKIQLAQVIASTSMTMAQATSLRSSLLQEKAMSTNHRILRKRKELYKMYQSGRSVLELSKDIDCPPMNIFRVLLAEMNFSKGNIKKSLRDPQENLKEREQKEFYEADAADFVNSVNQRYQLVHADAFEDAIADWLDLKGISFKRQNQLITEQLKEIGTTVVTPDFLLLDQLEINGRRVNWIDCKAYYGANIYSIVQRMQKQMSRYIDIWGSGAVIYLEGCNEAVKMEGCSMLNAREAVNHEILLQMERKVSEGIR